MAQDSDAPDRRLTGEAKWKAARDETDRRNSEAKRRASEHVTASTNAVVRRELQMAAAERAQLKALNERIDARAAAQSAPVTERTPATGV